MNIGMLDKFIVSREKSIKMLEARLHEFASNPGIFKTTIRASEQRLSALREELSGFKSLRAKLVAEDEKKNPPLPGVGKK